VKGVTGDVANTSGGEVITASTLIKEIDGYTDHETDDYIYLAGTDTDGSGVGPDTTFTITDDKTIGDLLTKIEDLFGDVTASVTGDGEVMVIDNTGGSDLSLQIAVKDADTSDDDTLNFDANDDMGSAATTRKRQLVAGLDASIVVDGVTISKSENIVDDVISGVTLNLLNADQDTTVTLTVDRDVDSTIDKISTVVDNYNTIIAYIYEQQSYDADNETTGGILFGDNTLSLIKSQLTSVMLEPIWGVSSNFSTMGLAGINVDNEGQLSINSSTLKGYLETNFNDMKLLFAASGTTDTGSLEYISHTRDSNAGEYSVDITQAATLASETGTTSLGTLSGAETLTISDGSQTATVSLENGDTLTEIVSEINTELDTVYTETLAGVNILYEGSGESTLADAGTTWSQLYVGAGTANLVNNDEIHFDGTTRSGTVVSSYYTISNASTDTVQGLLSAIESAYSNKIAASINSSGRIVLTDKYSGTSDLSITFDYDQTENQVDLFGTVLTTNTGGQEGRYAIGVTASDDGSNHLVLTHDNYGSGSSFTISQSGDTNIQEIVYSDTAKTTSVSSGQIYASGSTTWDGIYDTTVNTTDTITITGTTHGNDAVGPTAYNIYSAAYKDIDSLLSAIEAAFTAAGGSVDARIEDGKIIVEDQVSGDGSTSLTLTYNNEGSGSDLDMGTIDQTTDRDLDLGLVNGTFSGLDVVGTINGESATGSGQILTGDEDENNVDGLSIRYTGTDTGAIGDVTLTLGVAEAFERTLYAITDSLEGYVANKEESLQNSIDSFESLIERMEARLEQKMEMMINRFVAMELALSKIQSQSDWLSGQIDAANSGWI